MQTAVSQMQTESFAINIPKIDLKRFKGLAKAMGWSFEKLDDMDETAYVMSNPKIMDAIHEGDEAIAKGNVETTTLDELWK